MGRKTLSKKRQHGDCTQKGRLKSTGHLNDHIPGHGTPLGILHPQEGREMVALHKETQKQKREKRMSSKKQLASALLALPEHTYVANAQTYWNLGPSARLLQTYARISTLYLENECTAKSAKRGQLDVCQDIVLEKHISSHGACIAPSLLEFDGLQTVTLQAQKTRTDREPHREINKRTRTGRKEQR